MSARLLRVPFERRLDPVEAALLVRGDERPFALCGRWAGGGAVVGSEPVRVADESEDPFGLLDDQPVLEGAMGAAEGAVGGLGGAVGGGWFGWLGYRLGRRLEPTVGPPPPRPVALPAFALAFYDHVLRQDDRGRWWFEALWTPERDAALKARLAALRDRAGTSRAFATAPWRSVPGPAGHAAAVAACVERIREGDLFQANVTLRLESTLEGDALDLWVAGVRATRPDRAAYLSGPWGAVASLSPELFLARVGRAVRSAPIKGTRPLGRRAELVASEKDRAENVMIVDLVRNDLGRVCVPGSVRVEALAEARAHAGVWHLVSEVSGELRAGAGDAALVRAAFPPGSVTGAPKVAALGVIAALESTGREAYTGAIGFASALAGLELNVAIRTFETQGRRVWLGVGGGIVADSEPAEEAAEAATKAAPLLHAIGGRLDAPPTHGLDTPPPRGLDAPPTQGLDAPPPRGLVAAPRPLRLGPRPVPRPDPAWGVFATILVRDGAPVALDAHLARLERSVRALYGVSLPPVPPLGLPAHGRLRLIYDGRALRAETGPLPAPEPFALRAVTLPGGLGAHKWVDRRLLDALARATAPAVPLLVDLDGLVLEAAWANVFVVLPDGALVTPPADGRILPGVTRERLIAERGARETPVPLATLHGAREILVTSALRGAVPATLVTPAAPTCPSRPHPARR